MTRVECTTSLVLIATTLGLWSIPPASAQVVETKESPTGVPESFIARNFPKNGDPDARRAALAQRGIT